MGNTLSARKRCCRIAIASHDTGVLLALSRLFAGDDSAYRQKNGVKVVRQREKAPGESESSRFVPLDRHDGVLLNGISFAGPRVRRHRRVSEGGGIRL